MKHNNRIPLNVSSMSADELQQFKAWLHECCGMDFDEMSENQLHDGAARWQDEQFKEANKPEFST